MEVAVMLPKLSSSFVRFIVGIFAICLMIISSSNDSNVVAQTVSTAVVTTWGPQKFYRLASETGKANFFYRAQMTVDADGAPNCYGPNDVGTIDYLEHAGTPGNWWALATDTGDPSGTPIKQKAGDPFPGLYIAQTSLGDPNLPDSNPRKWVDATSIPFFVMPASSSFQSATGTRVGDLGLVIWQNKYSFAIFADESGDDVGEHVGEGSVYLAQQLGHNPFGPTGKVDFSIEPEEVYYFVFPGTSLGRPLTKTEIQTMGAASLARWGGFAKVRSILQSVYQADCTSCVDSSTPTTPTATPTPTPVPSSTATTRRVSSSTAIRRISSSSAGVAHISSTGKAPTHSSTGTKIIEVSSTGTTSDGRSFNCHSSRHGRHRICVDQRGRLVDETGELVVVDGTGVMYDESMDDDTPEAVQSTSNAWDGMSSTMKAGALAGGSVVVLGSAFAAVCFYRKRKAAKAKKLAGISSSPLAPSSSASSINIVPSPSDTELGMVTSPPPMVAPTVSARRFSANVGKILRETDINDIKIVDTTAAQRPPPPPPTSPPPASSPTRDERAPLSPRSAFAKAARAGMGRQPAAAATSSSFATSPRSGAAPGISYASVEPQPDSNVARRPPPPPPRRAKNDQ